MSHKYVTNKATFKNESFLSKLSSTLMGRKPPERVEHVQTTLEWHKTSEVKERIKTATGTIAVYDDMTEEQVEEIKESIAGIPGLHEPERTIIPEGAAAAVIAEAAAAAVGADGETSTIPAPPSAVSIYILKDTYTPEEGTDGGLFLLQGQKVELVDTSSPHKRARLDDDEAARASPLLDNTAAKYKIGLRPKKNHPSAKMRSPTPSHDEKWLVRDILTGQEGLIPSRLLEVSPDDIPPPPPPPPAVDMQSVESTIDAKKLLMEEIRMKKPLRRRKSSSKMLLGASPEDEAKSKRLATIRELIETEEEFARDLQFVMSNYYSVFDNPATPRAVRDQKEMIFSNFKYIADFHQRVLIEGVKYHADTPRMIGKTFLRLERDFDQHAEYCSAEPLASEFIANNTVVREFFEDLSQSIGDDKRLEEHLKLPIQRLNDYQLLLKELVKFGSRLGDDTGDLDRAYELMQTIPQRATDSKFISSIEGFKGNLFKLGRLIRHDWFNVSEVGHKARDRYLFLFKARILITKVKRISDDRSVFILKDIIRLPETSLEGLDLPQTLEFNHIEPENHPNYPIVLEARNPEIRENWLNIVQEHVVDTASVEDLLFDDEIRVVSPVDEEGEERAFLSPAGGEEEGLQELPKDLLQDLPKPEDLPEPIHRERVVPDDSILEQVDLEDEFWNTPLNKQEVVKKVESTEVSTKRPKEEEVDIWDSKASPPPKKRASTTTTETVIVEEVYSSSNFQEEVSVQKFEQFESSVHIEESTEKTRVKRSKEEAEEESDFWSSKPSSPPPKKRAPSIVEEAPDISQKTSSPKLVKVPITYEKVLPDVEPTEEEDFWSAKPSSSPVLKRQKTSPTEKETPEQAEVVCPSPDIVTKTETVTTAVVQEEQQIEPEDIWSIKPTEHSKKSVSETAEVEESISKTSEKELILEQVEKSSAVTADLAEQSEQSKKQVVPAVKLQSDTSTSSKSKTSKFTDRKKSDSFEDTKSKDKKLESDKSQEKTVAKKVFDIKTKKETSPLIKEIKLVEEDTVKAIEKVISPKRSKTTEENKTVTKTKKPEESKPTEEVKIVEELKPVTKSKTEIKSVDEVKPLEKSKQQNKIKPVVDVKPIKEIKSVEDIKEEEETKPVKKLSKSNLEKESKEAKKREAESEINLKATERKKSKQSTEEEKAKVEPDLKQVELKSKEKKSLEPVLPVKSEPGPEKKKIVEVTQKEEILAEVIVEKTKTVDVTEKPKVEKSDVNLKLPKKVSTADETKQKAGKEAKLTSLLDSALGSSKSFKSKSSEGKTSTMADKKPTEGIIGMTHDRPEAQGTRVPLTTVASAWKAPGAFDKPSSDKPVFTKTLTGDVVEPGDSTHFDCEVTHDENYHVTWLKNNRAMDDKLLDRVQQVDDNKKHSLKIMNCRREDSGTYTAKVTDTVGVNACSTAHLLVQELSEEERSIRLQDKVPFFEVGMKNAEVIENSNLSYAVHVKGDPMPTVNFFKDGVKLVEDNRIKLVKDLEKGHYELIFTNVRKDDAGTYKCVAMNKHDKAESQAELTVKEEQQAMNNLSGKGSLLNAGEKPDFTWFRDGVEMDPVDRFNVLFKDEEDTLALVFQNVTPDDAGIYTCVASTSCGKISCSAELTVEGSVKRMMKDPAPPSFIEPLQDTYVNVNGTAMLECAVTGYPKPDLEWYKNMIAIKIGGRYKMMWENDENVTLIIKSIEESDRGTYTVYARNEIGEEDCSCKLCIRSGPKFHKIQKEVACIVDKPLTYMVDVDGEPLPELTWTKDGKVISDPRFSFGTNGEGTYHMKIELMKMEDCGVYTITASNDQGQRNETFEVQAETPPEIMKEMDPECEKKIMNDHTFEVRCKGAPAPVATWYKDDKELTGDERHKIMRDEQFYTLRIRKLDRCDRGVYKVVLKNALGEAECQCVLVIRAPPFFSTPLKDACAKEGAKEIKMFAQWEAVPRATCKWFYKDRLLTVEHSEGYTYRSTDDTSLLTIKEANEDVVGTYTLKASNEYGDTSCKARFRLHCKPEILEELVDQEFLEDISGKFRCRVHGVPVPEIKWTKDGKKWSPDEKRVRLAKDDEDTYVILMDKTHVEDTGHYACVISNCEGEVKMEADLLVTTPPHILSNNFSEGKTFVAMHKTVLEIEATAVPDAEATWTCDDKELTEEEELFGSTKVHIKFSFDGKKYKLERVGSDPLQSGLYKCVLKNKMGSAEVSGQITIIEKEARVRLALKNCAIKEYTDGTICCQIVGDPIPSVEWFRNGKPLPISDRYEVREERDKRMHYLTFKNVEERDKCTFTCKGTNTHGTCETTCEMAICVKPQPGELQDTTVDFGGDLLLTLFIHAIPVPEMDWYQNNSRRDESNRIEYLRDEESEIYSLKVMNVTLEDAGSYTFKATNVAGEAVGKSTVKIHTEKPTIIENISDASICLEDSVTFKIKGAGLPLPEVEWRNKKVAVNDAERYTVTRLEKDVYSITLTDITLADYGEFAAVAKNLVGEAVSTAKLTQKKLECKILEDLEHVTKGPEGEDVTLKILVQASPRPTFSWYRDGDLITDGDKYRLTFTKTSPSEGYISCTILEASAMDSGQFRVKFSNELNEVETETALIIRAVRKGPRITKKPEDFGVVCMKPGMFKAKIVGYPKPDVTWSKEGRVVLPTDICSSGVTADGFYYLEFKHVTVEDGGRYTVVARNELGCAECEANLTVEPFPAKPEFLQGLQPANVIVGYPARLEVILGGSPKPTVTWMKDGVPLVVDGQHLKQATLDDGTVYLIFDKAIPEDAGEYSVVATNSEGDNSSSAEVTVLGHDRDDGQDGPAKFGEGLKDSTFDEGKTLRLPVTVKGGPVPDMKWFKDGKELTLDDRAFYTYDGDKTFLEIRPCVGSDSGVYKCVISNEHGDDSTECEVTIRKCFEPPTFTHGFTSQQQLPGRDAKFSVKIDGVPRPELTWFCDGKQIVPDGEKYRVRKDADGCTLLVRDCTYSDSGEYKCVATNREGSTECKGTLTVADEIDPNRHAEAPNFLKVIGDQELYMGYTARFKAVVSGRPLPEFEWLRNNEKLQTNSRVIAERDHEGLLRLTIQHVCEADAGSYTLKVWNIHGKASCKGKLICECLSKQGKRPVGDEYQGFDKLRRTGVPIPLPETPIISALSDKRVTISWIPFLPAAPMPPVTYQVEMCECPEGDWFTAKTGIRGCAVDILNLNPKSDYRFRIRCENKFGVSEPSPYATTYRIKLERHPISHEPFLDTAEETFKDGPYVPPGFIINRDEKSNFWAPPRFLRQEFDTQYATKDFNARIKWIAYGYPTPKLRFYFNDKEIKFTKHPRYSFVQEAEGDIFLFMEKVTKKDIGKYTCTAVNEYGESKQNVNFDLCEYPRVIQHLQETYMRSLTSGKITCKILGFPPCDVKWFKDWEEITPSIKLRHQFVPPDTYSLNFHGPVVKDSGLYSLAAVNVAGAVSSSSMVHVEQDDLSSFNWTGPSRGRHVVMNSKKGSLEDHYDIGDELGRGTQGVIYHCAEHYTGRNYAAKSMWGRDDIKTWMQQEFDMMNLVNSCKYVVRLYDAYEADKNMVLVEELCGGGELLPFLITQQYITEYDVAHYIRQILEGLDYMHDRCIAHCGLNLGDVMMTRPNGRDIKIGDLSLARSIRLNKLYPLDYGMPEYVAPEVAKGENITEKVDMWAVGIITYILLAGVSPFRGENDRETLTRLQKGELFFETEAFASLSGEAKDFIAKLLQYKPETRMDIKAAMLHPWMTFADQIPRDPHKIYTDRLRTYYSQYRTWMDNASCRRWFRRRALATAFTHPSKMVYPPGEVYTPPESPCRDLVPYNKNTELEPYVIPHRDLSYELDVIRNDSHYQQGPDTYLLQLRDPDFPVRLRQYMKVAADRSPAYAIAHRSEGFDYDASEKQLAVEPVKRERRKKRDRGEFKPTQFIYHDDESKEEKEKISQRSQAIHRATLDSSQTYNYRRQHESAKQMNFKGYMNAGDREFKDSDRNRN